MDHGSWWSAPAAAASAAAAAAAAAPPPPPEAASTPQPPTQDNATTQCICYSINITASALRSSITTSKRYTPVNITVSYIYEG